MQPTCGVRPPIDRDRAPLRHNSRMMVLPLGDLPYSHGKLERRSEIGEAKRTADPRFARNIDDSPCREFEQQSFYLVGAECGYPATARNTRLVRKVTHGVKVQKHVPRDHSGTGAVAAVWRHIVRDLSPRTPGEAR